jgi:retron-type reverse transcriptase
VDGIKTVPPAQRLRLVDLLGQPDAIRPRPTRRVWIPKPGKTEKRPLGIPVMLDRAHQALVKLALEPEWEVRFEPNTYGFRPGRSVHDAIAALFQMLCFKDKYVLDADIQGCFDNIAHSPLLDKLATFLESASTMVGAAATASRWLEIETRIRDAQGLSEVERRVLKTIGVLRQGLLYQPPTPTLPLAA